MKQLLKLFVGVLLLALLSACQTVALDPKSDATSGADSGEPTTLVVGSHDSFAVSEEVLAEFEETNNVTLQFLELGDAGEALNKIILSKNAPLADVFYGVDNTFLSRALNAEIFMPYESPMLANVPDDLKLDPNNTLLPMNFGFVNLNADKGWFAERGLDIPTTLDDLTDPAYAGTLVVMNPATSSPGLAFLITTVAYFGEDGYLDFWQSLADNDVLITSGWSEAYFEHYTVGSGDDSVRPMVVTYASSPPADVLYASDGRTEPASVNISPSGATFRQIEFAGILKGTEQPELAQKFIDFMMDTTFQEDIPLQMLVYPANVNAQLPEIFAQFAEPPADPAVVDPADIETNRETWINAWTELMLR